MERGGRGGGGGGEGEMSCVVSYSRHQGVRVSSSARTVSYVGYHSVPLDHSERNILRDA